MSTRNKNRFDFKNVLNSHLAENDTFRKLFEAVGNVTNDLVQEKITQLARVRDPRIVHRGDYIDTPHGRGVVTYVKRDENALIVDEVHVDVPNVGSVIVNMRTIQDRSILINGARTSGFDYFSDSLSDDDYARIYQFVNEYWPLSSNENFVNFMGYINKIRLDIHQLWSIDYDGAYQIDPSDLFLKETVPPPESDNPPDEEDPDETEEDTEDTEEDSDSGEGVEDDIDPEQPEEPEEPEEPVTPAPIPGWPDEEELPYPILERFDPERFIPVWEGGTHYPTSHVELEYDALDVTSSDKVSNLAILFYYLAPIHLVLERTVANLSVEVNYSFKAVGDLYFANGGYMDLSFLED